VQSLAVQSGLKEGLMIKKRQIVKYSATLAAVVLATCLGVSPALADASSCKTYNGNAVWTLIASPNDPFGRVLGPATGDIKAVTSAYIVTLVADPTSGIITATSVETWVSGPKDMLVFSGHATFTPIPGQPVGTVYDSNTLTVTGGTGIYAGATGFLNVTGAGFNIFGPNSSPGNGFFDIFYSGNICTSVSAAASER
jgi:hypothetical protein